MSENRLRLGETLIEAKVLKPEELERALALQQRRQLRLGTILLQEGFVTEPQLIQALSHQLSIPWVSLWHIDIHDQLLQMVPVNVAEEFFLIPIYIRSTKDGKRALYVAMNDPTDDAALRFVSASAGMPVKPMIAGPSDIAEAIRVYYYDEEDETKPVADSCPPRMSSIPPPAGEATPTAAATAAAAEAPPLPMPGEDSDQISLTDAEIQFIADEEEAIPERDLDSVMESDPAAPEEAVEDNEEEEARPSYPTRREAERHLFGVGRKEEKRGFSLTLLDGTMVSFGSASKKQTKEPYGKEDLVKGLRALSFGTPMDDLLPADKWERYMAALLEVLFKKHLVLFDEFMDALKKE